MTSREDTPVAHGWTLADAERIAGRAARDHPSALLSRADRQDAAVHAVIEAILAVSSAEEVPSLLRAARDGLMRQQHADHQFRGLSRPSGFTERSASFARYWWQPPLSGWEDAIVDRIALGQVWAAISPAHRRVLSALAENGDHDRAARALGTTDATYRSRLRDARKAFRVLWHEGEVPPGQWGRDRRSGRRGEVRKGTVVAARQAAVRRHQREARRAA